jgi:hypothetical protein
MTGHLLHPAAVADPGLPLIHCASDRLRRCRPDLRAAGQPFARGLALMIRALPHFGLKPV